MDHSTAPVQAEGFSYTPDVADTSNSAAGFLLDAMRRRRLGRAIVSGLTILLFVAGTGMFTYPFFSDIYTDRFLQPGLQDEFSRIQAGSVDEWEATLQPGKPLTRIVIPAIDVDMHVVSGTSPAALRAGAGHYPNTPLPGQAGNVAIAGHRTTYGRPFNRVDELDPGDEIWLLTPIGDYRYVVTEDPWVTHPRDWSVIAPSGDSLLTLTTCHPKGSAAQRLIVRAELQESLPAGEWAAGSAA
jgi:sortase A